MAARLRQAGAICLGKLNTTEFASGSMEVFGTAHNPWNTAMFPGGSSAGSGTALAAHMVPLATGSDTGGSIRNPASFCGIVGFKPTYGCVSRAGINRVASRRCDQHQRGEPLQRVLTCSGSPTRFILSSLLRRSIRGLIASRL